MIILQMNEVNFAIVQKYIDKGYLPGFNRLLNSDFAFFETESEPVYEQLEPWIQWVSFYTGKSYKEHKIFHLGDYVKPDENDLFKVISQQGWKVGLFGAMNHCGFEDADIYVPDPWSTFASDKSYVSRCTQKVVNFLVNRNAEMASPFAVLWPLMVMFLSTRGFKKYSVIMRALLAFLKRDRALLSGYFDFFFLLNALTRHKKSALDLSSVFLNGVAHVQHHYMINASVLAGKNPDWYIGRERDPLLDSLTIYDELITYMHRQNAQFSIVTGLSQEPYKTPEIYWRFKDHAALLTDLLGVACEVTPRMTRDFHIEFKSEKDAKHAFDLLKAAKVHTSSEVSSAFGYVDVSGKVIFATLIYAGDHDDVTIKMNGKERSLKSEITFVAIKNAGHISTGWALLPKEIDISILADTPKVWEVGQVYKDYLTTSNNKG